MQRKSANKIGISCSRMTSSAIGTFTGSGINHITIPFIFCPYPTSACIVIHGRFIHRRIHGQIPSRGAVNFLYDHRSIRKFAGTQITQVIIHSRYGHLIKTDPDIAAMRTAWIRQEGISTPLEILESCLCLCQFKQCRIVDTYAFRLIGNT